GSTRSGSYLALLRDGRAVLHPLVPAFGGREQLSAIDAIRGPAADQAVGERPVGEEDEVDLERLLVRLRPLGRGPDPLRAKRAGNPGHLQLKSADGAAVG